MKLLGNRIHLRPLPQATRSAGGILYAEAFRDDQKQFEVLAVGPGRKTKKGVLIPPEVKPGDRVLAELYHEHTILPDGTRIADASAILATWPANETNTASGAKPI